MSTMKRKPYLHPMKKNKVLLYIVFLLFGVTNNLIAQIKAPPKYFEICITDSIVEFYHNKFVLCKVQNKDTSEFFNEKLYQCFRVNWPTNIKNNYDYIVFSDKDFTIPKSILLNRKKVSTRIRFNSNGTIRSITNLKKKRFKLFKKKWELFRY
jgi:hypothetical protein